LKKGPGPPGAAQAHPLPKRLPTHPLIVPLSLPHFNVLLRALKVVTMMSKSVSSA